MLICVYEYPFSQSEHIMVDRKGGNLLLCLPETMFTPLGTLNYEENYVNSLQINNALTFVVFLH